MMGTIGLCLLPGATLELETDPKEEEKYGKRESREGRGFRISFFLPVSHHVRMTIGNLQVTTGVYDKGLEKR